MLSHFTPIGITEAYTDNPVLNKSESTLSKFSMLAKTRNVSIESARRKIDTLRKLKGQMINATKQAT